MASLGLTSGLTVALLVPLLQAAGLAETTTSSRVLAWAGEWFGGSPPLGLALGIFFGVTALQGGLTWWRSRLQVQVTQEVAFALRNRVFRCATEADWATYTRSRGSDALHVLTVEIDRVAAATGALLALAAGLVVAAVYVGLALAISVPMTLGLMAAGGGLAFWLRRVRRAAVIAGRQFSESSRAMYGSLTESLAGMKLIRGFGLEAGRLADLDDKATQLRLVADRAVGIEAAGRLWLDVGAVGVLAVLTFGAVRVFSVPGADLLVLLYIFMRLAPQLSSLHDYYQTLRVDLQGLAAVRDFEMRLRVNVNLRARARTADDPAPALPFEREIVFDQVTFGYTDQPVLEGVNLRIPRGSMVALVGPSGSGKTTIADLLLGLLTPRSGVIRVDDRLLTPADGPAWRARVGFVPQDGFLFHDTVADNLRWAAPGATDHRLWLALDAASAGFVAGLPYLLQTVVGDRGALLSGGERQRLALARALLRDPALLILDEATSALDAESEGRILEALDGLRGRVTMLVIAHRLSTVSRADCVYVLDEGRILEAGTWRQLVSRPSSRFRDLYGPQLSAIEPMTVFSRKGGGDD
jgi:ATP-binding cassette subfamily C protein